MKLKNIMLMTLLLFAILTVGAVSASEDADNITAADEMDAIDSPGDECEVIASDSVDEVVAQGENKKNVTINDDWPEEIYYGQNVNFEVYITPEDEEWDDYPEGEVIFYVNDEEIGIENVEYAGFEYTFEDFGTYTVKVEYGGDENFNPSEKIFTYNLTNSMYKISVDDEIYFLRNTFGVYSPVWNPGEIVITINGKKFNVFDEEDNGDYYCNASALNYGLNTVNIYYPGDDYFAEYSADENITLYSRVKIDEYDIAWGEAAEIYVEVPGDATGTLNVYSLVGYDMEGGEIFKELGSADVSDGVARVILNDLPVGEHEIYAAFTGSVDVRSEREYVYIDPKVTVPKAILTGEDANVIVEADENAKYEMKVLYADYDEDGDVDYENYEFLASANIVDGQAKIPLSGLKKGHYTIKVTAEDLGFSRTYSLYVVDKYDVSLNITYSPEDVIINSEYNYIGFEIADYADGNITLYIDGKAVETISAEDGGTYFNFNSTGLDLGEHTLTINFTSETQGISCDSVKFNAVAATIYIPDKITINTPVSANAIQLLVTDNAKGTITILIDDDEYLSESIDAIADENTQFFYNLDGISLEKHDVTVIYNDKYGIVRANKTVDFGYKILIYANCRYGEDNIIEIDLPNNLGNGDLTVTLDGNKLDYVRNSSQIIINPSKLSLAYHTVEVKYAGDDFYPAENFNETFEIYATITGPENDIFIGSEKGIALFLPDDAKGKLNVSVEMGCEDEDGYWDYVIYDTQLVSFEDGKAYYSLAGLPIGEYAVYASYTENDYYIYSGRFYFEVNSIDWGNSYLELGENKTITFISEDKNPGQLIVVLSRYVDYSKEWDDPVNVVETLTLPIVDGKVSHTFTKLKIGDYHIFVGEEFVDGGLKGFQGSSGFYVNMPYIEIKGSKFAVGNITPVKINFPADADGKITVKVSNYTEGKSDLYNSKEFNVDGMTVIDLNEIIADEGRFSVSFNYTGNYGEFYDDYYFTITGQSKLTADIDVVVTENVNFGDDVVLNINTTESDSSNVTVTIDDVNYKTSVASGKSTVTIPNLKSGSYEARITFEGDSKYMKITKTVSFTVNKVNSTLTVGDIECDYGTAGTTTATFEGAIEIGAAIEGVLGANITVNGGEITVYGLNAGTYTLNVYTVCDENHESVTRQAKITVNKVNSTLTVGDIECDYNTASTADVTFSGASEIQAAIEGILGANITVGDGKITVYGLNPGTYTLAVTTIADDNHNQVTKKAKVTVLGKQTTMNVTCDEIIKKGSTLTINVEVGDAASGNILVSIGNMNLSAPLENGKASIQVPNLAVGKYNVVIAFTGNEVYNPITQTKAVSVVVDPAINAKNTNVVYAANGKYTVTVYGTDGKLAKNTQVIFKIAGKQVAKVNTNDKGVATYTVKNVPGKYKISATALGKTATKTLTVKHLVTLKSAAVKKSAKKLVLTATLGKVNGKYLKGKKITFKFNGKKYAAKTNAKGVAKVTIKKAVLNKLKVGKKIAYTATYAKDTVKRTAKVKK